MKINAITSFNNNFVSKCNPNRNVSYASWQPSFEGVLDVFKKQQPVEKSIEQQESDDINDILKSAIMGDKALKTGGKVFLKHLNKLLKEGKKDNYRGYLHFDDKKAGKNLVTFGDIDESLNIPSTVNVWQDGKLKTVYEVESVLPQSIYTITTYDENRQCFYRFINDRNLGFQSIDNEGIVVAQYPAENGFCQQQSKKVNANDALLYYELYWDYKHPEKSYMLQNTEGDAIRYGYDKKRKFWYEKEIIPYEKKGETPTFNAN